MHSYTTAVRWRRKPDERFLDGRYNRAHEWAFDGGARVPALSSPHVVRLPFSDPAGVDPEEAFVTAGEPPHTVLDSPVERLRFPWYDDRHEQAGNPRSTAG